MVTIRIPLPTRGAVSNWLGLVGFVSVLVAIGGLAGWLWALLTFGLVAVGLSYLAHVASNAPVRQVAAAQSLHAVPDARAA